MAPQETGPLPLGRLGEGQAPLTAASAPVVEDPARRADVLFRRRGAADHEVSAWWFIGAFVATTVAVITTMSFIPG